MSYEPSVVPTLFITGGATIDPVTYTFQNADGTAEDLSAYTFDADWRTSRDSATAIPLTVDATNKATGVIVVSGTAANSIAMGQAGVWDLRGTNGSIVRYFVTGPTIWTQGVTRD